MMCPPGSAGRSLCETDRQTDGGQKGERTVEEVALLDAELAYAGSEPEEGEAEDGAEQGHGCWVGFGDLGEMVEWIRVNTGK